MEIEEGNCMPGRHPPLQTLLDMPTNSFIAGMLVKIAGSAHLIFFL